MRVFPKAKRLRIALAYAIAACVTLIGAVWIGALAEELTDRWFHPRRWIRGTVRGEPSLYKDHRRSCYRILRSEDP